MTSIQGNFKGINFKMTTRTDPKQLGFICLPMVKNIPERGNVNWKKMKCPECGRECWMTPDAKVAINRSGGNLKGVCTECALKKGMGKKDG